IDGAHPHDVSTILDHYGVAVRAGTHCAEPLLARYGVTSTCRASFAMYNTVEEVDRLVEAVHKAREMFGLGPKDQMTEKTQKEDVARSGAEPETTAAGEPADIRACVGATGGGEETAIAGEGPMGDDSAIPPEELERLRTDLIAALKTVFDPEIPV